MTSPWRPESSRSSGWWLDGKTENDDLLPQLRKPVLITHGVNDTIVLPAAAEQHAAAIPQAQTSFYPNGGHAPFFEDAARFNRELRAFAKRL
jgi:pimeloyl-ACP methyl ester carboxylesterase